MDGISTVEYKIHYCILYRTVYLVEVDLKLWLFVSYFAAACSNVRCRASCPSGNWMADS